MATAPKRKEGGDPEETEQKSPSSQGTVNRSTLYGIRRGGYNQVGWGLALLCGVKPFPPDRGYVRGSRVITLFMS